MFPAEIDVDTLFCEAIAIDDAAQRVAFIERASGGNRELSAYVAKLVSAHFRAGEFLQRPIPSENAADRWGVSDPRTINDAYQEVGTVIGPYKIRELLGEGGMGSVYLAEQQQPVRRKVALKVIKPGMDSRHVLARFEAERVALTLMDHPNIAKVLDAGTTGLGRPYFVMELVKGMPITEHCDVNRLSTADRLQLFQQVCRAVQHAHLKGIVHRDLKPSNVIVAMYDATPVVKVIDFGVAKALGQQLSEATVYTGFHQLIGTPMYMSPEQAGHSNLDIDSRSDIYSLGVLLYELLTGRPPFEQELWHQVGLDEMRRIVREVEPVRPSVRVGTLLAGELSTISQQRQMEPRQLRRQLCKELDWIVLKAMEKDRARRYITASALALDIERYLGNAPIEASPPSRAYRIAKFARRHVALLSSLGTVIAVLMITSAVSLWLAREARLARQLADRMLLKEQTARQQLVTREATLHKQAYISDLGRAWNAWTGGDTARAHSILDRHTPESTTLSSQEDPSEFAWFYLNAHCNPPRTSYKGHTAPLLTAAVAPNNQLVAGADRAGNIRVWDYATGREVAAWNYSSQEINTVAFSHDSQLLATAGMDGTVRLYSIPQCKEIACLGGHRRTVTSISWSPDGHRLASSCREGEIRIWDTNEFREITCLMETDDVVHCVAWSPDGRLLAAADGPLVRLWNTENWSPHGETHRLPKSILAIAFNSNGRWLACGGYGGDVMIWDVATGTALMHANATSVTVWALIFSPDDRYLLGGLGNGGPNIWQVRASDQRLELLREAVEQSGTQRAVMFAEQGRALLTANEESGCINRWDFADSVGHRLIPYDEHCLTVVSEQEFAVIALSNGTVHLQRVSDVGEPMVLAGHGGRVTRAVVDPDERFLATCSLDNDLLLWDFKSGQRLMELPVATPTIDGIGFVPSQSLLAVASPQQGIALWDVTSGRPQMELRPPEGSVHSLAFSADGFLVAAASMALPRVYVWDVRTGRQTVTLTTDQSVYRLLFLHDGKRLLAGGRSNSVLIWDVQTGEEVGRLLGHRGGIVDMAATPDSRTLATIGMDQTVRLWDLPTGEQLLALPVGYVPEWVKFTTRQRLLIGVELDGQSAHGICVFDGFATAKSIGDPSLTDP